MSLIKSISGIRGTIGGCPGEGLSPLDVVKFTAAYASFIRNHTTRSTNLIVVGRDARLSGGMVNDLVSATLRGMGFDVVNIGLASTPTTEVAVVGMNACSGMLLSFLMRMESFLTMHKVRKCFGLQIRKISFSPI